MSEDLDAIILQVINGALAAAPEYLAEAENNRAELGIENPKEFVYGIVMGMAMGMGGAVLGAQGKAPTKENQAMVRDAIYRHVPDIRARLLG